MNCRKVGCTCLDICGKNSSAETLVCAWVIYMKELSVSGSSSFILCCVRWPDMTVIYLVLFKFYGET